MGADTVQCMCGGHTIYGALLGGFWELTQGVRLGNKCLYLLSCLVGLPLHPSIHLMNPLNATGLQEHIVLPLFN